MQFTKRQEQIIDIVKNNEPITSKDIAKHLNLTRGALRPDLSILTMSGILDARPRVGYFYTGKTKYQVVSEAIGEIKVRDVKSRPAVIKEDTTVYQAIVTLFLEDTGSLFVVKEDGTLSGVISRKDLLKSVMSQGDFNKVPVGIIMTRMPNVVTITEDASLLEAAIKINEREVDSIPVVKQEGNRVMVVGKISKTNITRVFVELGKEGYRGNNL